MTSKGSGLHQTHTSRIHGMQKCLYEMYESLPRQGPGDDVFTKRAFDRIVAMGLPTAPQILDVGCGVGMQTLALAKLSGGHLTALDNHKPFLDTLMASAHTQGVADRVKVVLGDMVAMPFAPGSFDVVWSEGAAYIAGFENALKSWRGFLKPKGFMVISECVWFSKTPPAELAAFWDKMYPMLKHYEDLFEVVKAHGYTLLESFTLPHDAWWKNYYTPQIPKLKELRTKYHDDPAAQAAFNDVEVEIEMHRKYSAYYGYGFYVMQRIDYIKCSRLG